MASSRRPVSFRLDKAMQAFFRRVAAGETPGFPPGAAPAPVLHPLLALRPRLSFEGKQLILPTGGQEPHKRVPNILATLAEVPPGGFREVAISREARGHSGASFVDEAPEAEPQPGQVV